MILETTSTKAASDNTITAQDLYRAEENLYGLALAILDEKYGSPMFLVVHKDAELPRELVVWCKRDKRQIIKTAHLKDIDTFYAYNP